MNILHEFFKKITRELLRDRETMKSLSPSQRLRFIFDYYRGRIFLLLCLCLAVFLCVGCRLPGQPPDRPGGLFHQR